MVSSISSSEISFVSSKKEVTALLPFPLPLEPLEFWFKPSSAWLLNLPVAHGRCLKFFRSSKLYPTPQSANPTPGTDNEALLLSWHYINSFNKRRAKTFRFFWPISRSSNIQQYILISFRTVQHRLPNGSTLNGIFFNYRSNYKIEKMSDEPLWGAPSSAGNETPQVPRRERSDLLMLWYYPHRISGE